ncbi:MAG TPA: hypothetical protein VK179_07790 [Bacteroidales bacterium]|nr:hypothetical protein [Bacteroidales bacterium]
MRLYYTIKRNIIVTRTQIKRAGKILKEQESHSKEEIESAENTLTYWRTIHGKVINEFFNIVLSEVNKINKNATVVQRLKRSPSIIAKLKRFPQMQLTTMQDIAGIRAHSLKRYMSTIILMWNRILVLLMLQQSI